MASTGLFVFFNLGWRVANCNEFRISHFPHVSGLEEAWQRSIKIIKTWRHGQNFEQAACQEQPAADQSSPPFWRGKTTPQRSQLPPSLPLLFPSPLMDAILRSPIIYGASLDACAVAGSTYRFFLSSHLSFGHFGMQYPGTPLFTVCPSTRLS